MPGYLSSLLVTALLVALLPAGSQAQNALGGQAPTAEQAQIQGWIAELQQVHQQLEGVQLQALQDPELNAAQAALGEEVQAAMSAVDPSIGGSMSRVREIESEAVVAQQNGDMAALNDLMLEAQAIQQQFLTVQAAVMDQPRIAGMVSDFQVQLEARMVELDPSVKPLLERFRELESMVTQAMEAAA